MGILDPTPADKALAIDAARHAQKRAAEAKSQPSAEEIVKQQERHEENKRQGMI
jgi:hypothetical protein